MKVIVSVLALLTLSGCVLYDYEQHESRGVSLSSAMEASASGSKESVGGSGSHDYDHGVEVDTDTTVTTSFGLGSAGGSSSLVNYRNKEFSYQFPVDVAYAVPLNGDIQGITKFTITPVSFEDELNFMGVFLSGGIVDLKHGTLPDRATKNPWWFELGVGYRRYFNGPHVFVSPYFAANLSWQLLSWEYRNPIVVGSDTVWSDSLQGVGGYAGLGIAFYRKHRLSFFGEAGFGGTVFLTETEQGFYNDVFDDFGYFAVKAGLTLKF